MSHWMRCTFLVRLSGRRFINVSPKTSRCACIASLALPNVLANVAAADFRGRLCLQRECPRENATSTPIAANPRKPEPRANLWLAVSPQYKEEVLAQPTSANGDLQHIE